LVYLACAKGIVSVLRP